MVMTVFRLWVQELWQQNRDERLTWGLKPVTIDEYWTTSKWWLRREYRHQRKVSDESHT